MDRFKQLSELISYASGRVAVMQAKSNRWPGHDYVAINDAGTIKVCAEVRAIEKGCVHLEPICDGDVGDGVFFSASVSELQARFSQSPIHLLEEVADYLDIQIPEMDRQVWEIFLGTDVSARNLANVANGFLGFLQAESIVVPVYNCPGRSERNDRLYVMEMITDRYLGFLGERDEDIRRKNEEILAHSGRISFSDDSVLRRELRGECDLNNNWSDKAVAKAEVRECLFRIADIFRLKIDQAEINGWMNLYERNISLASFVDVLNGFLQMHRTGISAFLHEEQILLVKIPEEQCSWYVTTSFIPTNVQLKDIRIMLGEPAK